MSARLQAWLLDEGVLAGTVVRAAVARQQIYGGGLDTALLERDALSEAGLWAGLAFVSGLPPPPPGLCEMAEMAGPPALDAETTRPFRVVPVATEGDSVDLLCAEPVAVEELRALAAGVGLQARLYIVPETRLYAMRQRVYGEPLSARHGALLARVVGARHARIGYAGPAIQERRSPSRAGAPVAPQPARPESTAPEAVPAAAADAADAGAPTPLEYFLDLSGGLAAASSRAGEGEVDEAEVEADVEVLSSTPVEESSDGSSGVPVEEIMPEATGNSATEALCRRARDAGDKGRVLALRALRRRLTHPAGHSLLRELRATVRGVTRLAGPEPGDDSAAAEEARATDAIECLAELRDAGAVASLIDRLGPERSSEKVAAAAHRALVVLCAQDHGPSERKWRRWAENHLPRVPDGTDGDQEGLEPGAAEAPTRVEWLLEGLAHKEPAIRAAAAEDLRQLAGESFGYAFDAPKREREQARRRFVSWWAGTPKGSSTPPSPSAGPSG